MSDQHRPNHSLSQRRQTASIYDDELVALAQYEFILWNKIKQLYFTSAAWNGELGGHFVKSFEFLVDDDDELWDFIRDFDRGRHSLHYGPDRRPLPVHDSTPTATLIALLAELSPQEITWRRVLRWRRCTVLRSYVERPVAVGKRSDVIWKIGRTLREHGATAHEITTVLRASKVCQSKFGDNERRLAAEVRRIWEKP